MKAGLPAPSLAAAPDVRSAGSLSDDLKAAAEAAREIAAGSVCITPAGLRKAADLLEAGKIKDAITLIKERREAPDAKETQG